MPGQALTFAVTAMIVLEWREVIRQANGWKLIDALWEFMPADVDIPLHPDWAVELVRRVAAINASTGKAIPWHQIREEALSRIGHGTVT